ncbi:MAG: hypothetical protein HZC36_10860 [Armatimonadetes bacterium]|nr:hypothetical protein [Armatimonadota bacterium]
MFKAGASQVDISPPVGVELSGFVAREQPSVGVNDPLFANGLYLDDAEGGTFQWLHADLLGFDGPTCSWITDATRGAVNYWLLRRFAISATHTHSGPPLAQLNNCGAWEPGDPFSDRDLQYISDLWESFPRASVLASTRPQPATLHLGRAECTLSKDRRGFASAHVDHRLGALGIKREDGSYLAVLANYPCHPVALGGQNRKISGDLHGFAADHLSRSLPGRPVVLFTNGACGNLNPPDVGVDFTTCEAWGKQMADSALEALEHAEEIEGPIKAADETIRLPVEELSDAELRARAEALRAEIRDWNNEWVGRACEAVDMWERWMEPLDHRWAPQELPLQAIRIGPLKIACFGAEVFSTMGDHLRADCGDPLWVVGYANGLIGYVCPEVAYDEGGYEPASSFVYFNKPPLKRGCFEMARERMAALLNGL